MNTCIRFLNYQQLIIKTVCHTSGKELFNGEETSTDLSAGYQICTKQESFPHQRILCSDNVLWWDGWTGQKFCNDMHLHLKGIDVKLSLELYDSQ
ncbi:hypothetical protein GLOIN_2v1582196 [Rhizophagus clarus]|uniref:Uncharacterized protein n=1 Tax=Rhizophagus clarus TaxID=94130 RepID=A0A8H3QU02_9GLOM|nr:hypothetical protein GLOIN_2v1582196 [Rhizophagus clarus]